MNLNLSWSPELLLSTPSKPKSQPSHLLKYHNLRNLSISYLPKKRKITQINPHKSKSLEHSSLKKYNHPTNQSRQFYQSSKNIMKSYSSEFLSQSDSQQIERLLAKNKKSQQRQPDDLLKNHEYTSQNGFYKPERHLSSNMQNKKKLIQKIIKLYYEFFMDQNSESKAQEIMHIYKKKVCEQSQIPPTLFCWLNDWISKQFTNFIKTQISNLNQSKNGDKEKFKKQRIEQCGDQKVKKSQGQRKFRRLNRPNQVDMFFSIDLAQISEQRNNISSFDFKKQKNLNEDDMVFLRERNNLNMDRSNVFLTIVKSKQISPKIQHNKNQRGRRYYSSEISNLIAQKTQKNDDSMMRETIINESDSYPINRQVFIGAYYDRYYALYKNLQHVIPDLDTFYVKQIKRNDRKAEFRKRMKEVNRMFIRTQPLIKTSIDEYNAHYRQKNIRPSKERSKKQKVIEINSNNASKNHQILSFKNIQIKDYQKFRFSLDSEKDIPSNLLDKTQTQLLVNTVQPLTKKKEQKTKQKQIFTLNKPLQFSFNLPKIPDHQKGIQLKPKELSKIVLIHSGKYKFLDSTQLSQTLELSNKKNKNHDFFININDLKHKNNSLLLENERHISKSSFETTERSSSILEMITKKKKKSSIREMKFSSNQKYGINNEQIHQEGKKSLKTKSQMQVQRQDEKVPKQIAEIIQNLDGEDFYPLSGWEKGEETPVIS